MAEPVAVTKKAGGGLKPKQQLIKFLVSAPGRGSGVKGGQTVLAPALIEQVGEIEYGNWMVGMGIGWVEMGVIFHQEVYGVHGICQKANKEWFCVGSKYVKLLLQKMNVYQPKRS